MSTHYLFHMHLLNNLLFFHVSASAFHHISNLEVVFCLCPELFPFCWEPSSLTTPEGALGQQQRLSPRNTRVSGDQSSPGATPWSLQATAGPGEPHSPWDQGTPHSAGQCCQHRHRNSSEPDSVMGLSATLSVPSIFFFYCYFHFPFTLECFLISKGVFSSAGAFWRHW